MDISKAAASVSVQPLCFSIHDKVIGLSRIFISFDILTQISKHPDTFNRIHKTVHSIKYVSQQLHFPQFVIDNS